ncbi:unnamed protein product [Acanthosepion pharaonis]|uniref:Uncharacterized protein n=1 Tax=Acanthosepion pharaonis TaxID=158019 RepID=A0A812EDU8_ACAPH|nr:unnamed protein product [Sepia pharaonis]
MALWLNDCLLLSNFSFLILFFFLISLSGFLYAPLTLFFSFFHYSHITHLLSISFFLSFFLSLSISLFHPLYHSHSLSFSLSFAIFSRNLRCLWEISFNIILCLFPFSLLTHPYLFLSFFLSFFLNLPLFGSISLSLTLSLNATQRFEKLKMPMGDFFISPFISFFHYSLVTISFSLTLPQSLFVSLSCSLPLFLAFAISLSMSFSLSFSLSLSPYLYLSLALSHIASATERSEELKMPIGFFYIILCLFSSHSLITHPLLSLLISFSRFYSHYLPLSFSRYLSVNVPPSPSFALSYMPSATQG